MKSTIKTTVMALLLAGAAVCQAQPGQPGPNGKKEAPRGMRERRPSIEPLSALSGKIIAYNTNERYEYDGFTLQTADKTVTVKFPPQMGEQLMKSASKGAQVTVNGTSETTPEGELFRLYSLKSGDKTIVEAPVSGNEAPPANVLKDFSGTISELSHDRRGMVNGFVLDGKLLVELPPQAVEQLMSSLKTGTAISGSALQGTKPQGVVTAQNMQTARARTINLAGQTYLVR